MGKRERKYVRLSEKLAASLAMLLPQEVRDDLRERKVGWRAVMALFAFDHNVLHALGGSDRWWNLTPMPKLQNWEKATGRGGTKMRFGGDTRAVAKVRRMTIKEPEKWSGLLAPKRPAAKRRKPVSRWPKGKKIPTRSFR